MTLALAMILDAIFGEPKWLWSRVPHPVVVIGSVISLADQHLNQGSYKKTKGILFTVVLVAAAILIGLSTRLLPYGWIIDVILAAILLAHRSLVQHVSAVADGLDHSIEAGRANVAMIVGRDTSQMDHSAVARSAIESAAENFSDGVVAPAFWFAIGGLPGILCYKAVNTADSMIGYLTPRHAKFGWASARLDDVLNLIPARISAALMSVLALRRLNFEQMASEAGRHRSPNAGWPEAALSQVLNVALSGPRSYNGKIEEHPFVNPTGARELGSDHIRASIQVLWKSWIILLIIGTIALIALFLNAE